MADRTHLTSNPEAITALAALKDPRDLCLSIADRTGIPFAVAEMSCAILAAGELGLVAIYDPQARTVEYFKPVRK